MSLHFSSTMSNSRDGIQISFPKDAILTLCLVEVVMLMVKVDVLIVVYVSVNELDMDQIHVL